MKDNACMGPRFESWRGDEKNATFRGIFYSRLPALAKAEVN